MPAPSSPKTTTIRRARLVAVPLLLGALLVLAPPATASYVLDSYVGAPAVTVVPEAATDSASATPQPGDGVAPDSTRGTDADVAADQGVEDGTPVWIFYLVVVVVAAAGLVFGLLRNRRRKREH